MNLFVPQECSKCQGVCCGVNRNDIFDAVFPDNFFFTMSGQIYTDFFIVDADRQTIY